MIREAVALVVAVLVIVLATPEAEARRSILVLFDEDNDLPGLAVINRSLREVFKEGLAGEVDFYSESLNASQFKEAGYDAVMVEHLRRKYASKRPDLLVAVMGPSLHFILRHRDTLFPDVPVVFCGADASDIDTETLSSNMTGVLVKRTFAPTLDIALQLQPNTRHVFVVGGIARFDRQLQAIARRELETLAERASITYLTALPMKQLLERLSQLPAHSVVLYLSLFTDAEGAAFIPHDALSAITRAANAPVYVAVDQYIGLGAVGGHVYSIDTHGRRAAEIGLRILRGEAASNIPVLELAANANHFDWRALERWRLDERRLPAGSVVSFRAPSVWDQYKSYIVAGVMLLLLQSALIVGLLASHAQLRRAQIARRESERRRQLAEEEAQRQRDELAHALRVNTLGELTASFAHELGQPLTAITANARAARQLLAADRRGTKDVEEALADIAAAADNAAKTILRLRALFRKEHAERVAVDVHALIDDVLGLLGADIKAKHIGLRCTNADGLPAVLGDPVQLRQVVMNLLVNAEEAIALAGAAPREIDIRTARSGADRIVIAICDSGVGVEESELERIFERFVSSKPHGLGMGLAISRSIVEAHGGRIWATRNDDRGTTLNIELPCVNDQSKLSRPQAEAARSRDRAVRGRAGR